MRYIKVIFCILLLSFSINVIAKTVYVNDQLRVGVRPEPRQAVAPIGVVITGMRLEVLDQKNSFIKIRDEDGLEGWVKDIYVTDKTPAILRLEDMDKQYKTTQQQLADVEKTKVVLEQANASLNDKIESLKKQRAELQRNQAVQIISYAKSGTGLQIFLLIVFLGIGVAVGYFWHRYQIMKRLGGMRI